jgi:hypothetical protein
VEAFQHIYRKYCNGKSFFRILLNDRLQEVYFIGNKARYHEIPIATFADRMMQQHLIDADGEYVQVATEQEFEEAFQKTLSAA